MENKHITENNFEYLKELRKTISSYLDEAPNKKIEMEDITSYTIAADIGIDAVVTMLDIYKVDKETIHLTVKDEYDTIYTINIDDVYNACYLYIVEAIEEYIDNIIN